MAVSDDLRALTTDELSAELRRLEALAEARRGEAAGAASWRMVASLFAPLDEAAGRARVDALLRSASLDPDALRSRREGWIPWSEYEAMFDALEPLTDVAAAQLGTRFLDSRFVAFLPLGARTLPSLETVLRWTARIGVGPGGLLYRGCTVHVHPRGADEVRFIFVPPANGRTPRFFLVAGAAILEQLARLAGATRATVTTRREGDAASFLVRHDAPRRFRRLRALVDPGPASLGGAMEEARDELRQRTEELERRVEELERAERDHDALRRELEEQVQMEAVGRFAGAVAHDFNNLLTAMLGRLHLADDAATTDDTREALGDMREATERAASLARQLLAVGRRQPLDVRVVELDAALEAARPLLESATGEAVRVSLTLDAAAARVEVDTAQLERALVELALNGAEAMPDGGVLTIASATDARSRRARVTVTDSGAGMTPDVRARALLPYFTTRRDRRGAGLGLPTVYGIVRQLGGELSLRSAADEGTTAEIFLPLADRAP